MAYAFSGQFPDGFNCLSAANVVVIFVQVLFSIFRDDVPVLCCPLHLCCNTTLAVLDIFRVPLPVVCRDEFSVTVLAAHLLFVAL